MAKKSNGKIVSFKPYVDLNKKNKRKNNKKGKGVQLFVFILVLLLIIGIVCVCLFTDIFNIENISVKGINVAYTTELIDGIPDVEGVVNTNKVTYMAEEGASYYSIEDIISISGITIGNNIFKENLDIAAMNIQKAPYVKSAIIERKFPNILVIKVEERILKLFVDYVGTYVCIDKEGYCVNVINKADKVTNQPIIYGMIPADLITGFVEGELIDVDNPIKLQRVLNLLNLLEKNEINIQIESIDVSNVDEIIVKILDRKVTVNFGDMTNINLKIQFLPHILDDVGKKSGEILMTSTDDDLKPRFFEKI